MKKLALTLMAITIGLLLSIPAFAGPGEGMGPGFHGKAGFNKLNLSDEQKAKIEALVTANRKDIRPIREKLFDKSVALRRLWLQPNPDKEKILALQKEVRSLRDEMQDKVTALRFEIRKLLTPEQQEKLASLGWGKGSGFGPRGGMRGQGHGRPGMGMYN
jgi:Spy/CpxP family protein refolding chaperone